jgi:hypothetical protein
MQNIVTKTKGALNTVAQKTSNEVLVIVGLGAVEAVVAAADGFFTKPDYSLLKASALNTVKLLGLTAGTKALNEKFVSPAVESKLGENSTVAKFSGFVTTVVADALVNTGFYYFSGYANAEQKVADAEGRQPGDKDYVDKFAPVHPTLAQYTPATEFKTMGYVTAYDAVKFGLIEALNEGFIDLSTPELI